jgi:integrase
MASLSSESSTAKTSRKPTRDAEGSIIKRVEERRTSNGKTRKETVFYARVRYTDSEGKRREKKRRADSYNNAVIKRRELQNDIKKEFEEETAPEKPKTFNEILDFFETEFVKEAVYQNEQKIEGYREDLENLRRHIKLFREAFGKKLAARINYDDIRRYKNDRLATPVKTVYYEKVRITDEERSSLKVNIRQKFKRVKKLKIKQREFASVNRELARLRRILNIAIRQGWISVNPFSQGESLLQTSLETERLRICTLDEEKRLLASCDGRCAHFKPILITALDMALRKSEIFRLRWKDVHFDERRVYVQATNTKTGKARYVPLTSRVIEQIKPLQKDNQPTEIVFGITSDSNTAWDNALEETCIEGLRFHNLRATAITRRLRAGMKESEVMKISGHTQYRTFLKYVRQDSDGTATAADMMDSYLNALDK